MNKRVLATFVAILGVVGLATFVASPANAAGSARVVRWIDGDTVVTSQGTVRLIGMNTPEVGKCGFAAATALARRVAPAGSHIVLGNPRSTQDRDRYGRLLRYVNRGSVDVGLREIKAGAIAMYDGRDGYDAHPRQARYHRADRRNPNFCAHRRHHHAGGGGSYAPVSTYNCPKNARIKGNASSMIYHMPWNAYYSVTTPEECFATEAAAQAHGYRPAQI